MGDAVATYVDDEGQKWHVCAFWQPRPLSRRAEHPGSETEMATIVFERPGEERVATTHSIHGWDSEESLRELFDCAVERRSGRDRRSGEERRSGAAEQTTDSRTGRERRSSEPRRRCDRGTSDAADIRMTPATFSHEEAAQIRAMAIVGARPICPRCHRDLRLGPAVAKEGDTIHQLSCPRCARAVMVRGLG